MITYTKNYTRDNSLILQDGWGKGFVDGFEKWDKKKNPYSPINIYYVKDSVVEIWDSKEGFDWFFNKLTEKNKQDPNFFENITKTYKSYLDKINVFKKKCIKSGLIQELRDRRYHIKKSDKDRAKRTSARRRIAIENKKDKQENK